MKVLLIADLHVEQGIYTEISIDFLEHIKNYSKKNNVEAIIFAGDMFEKSSRIKNEAFVPLFFKLYELKELGLKLFFLLGNHDIYNVDNNSIVETFAVFGKVIKTLMDFKIGGSNIIFYPYTKNIKDIPTSGEILITHLPIADFTFDNKYHVNEKQGFKPELFEGFDIVFSGHFHRHQHKENIIYIGSPYQLSFEEMNEQKGFIELDIKKDGSFNWKRIIYDKAPEYIKIHINDFNDENVFNKFVGVIIDEKVNNFVQLKHILYEKGALNVIPYFEKKEDGIEEITDEGLVSFNDSISNLVKEHININVQGEKIDKKMLIKFFDKILEEV